VTSRDVVVAVEAKGVVLLLLLLPIVREVETRHVVPTIQTIVIIIICFIIDGHEEKEEE